LRSVHLSASIFFNMMKQRLAALRDTQQVWPGIGFVFRLFFFFLSAKLSLSQSNNQTLFVGCSTPICARFFGADCRVGTFRDVHLFRQGYSGCRYRRSPLDAAVGIFRYQPARSDFGRSFARSGRGESGARAFGECGRLPPSFIVRTICSMENFFSAFMFLGY